MKNVLLSIILLLLTNNCIDKRNGKIYEKEALSFLLLEENNAEPGRSCASFYESESSCVSSPQKIATYCNSTEYNRLKNGIQPTSSATDNVLGEYFRCWTSCNLSFNLESSCEKEKFSTVSDYRKNQRTDLKQSSINYKFCFENCKSENATFPLLNGSNFSVDPFVE
jgi:hypothetical protein